MKGNTAFGVFKKNVFKPIRVAVETQPRMGYEDVRTLVQIVTVEAIGVIHEQHGQDLFRIIQIFAIEYERDHFASLNVNAEGKTVFHGAGQTVPANVFEVESIRGALNLLEMNYRRCVQAVMHDVIFRNLLGHPWGNVTKTKDADGIPKVVSNKIGILSKIPHQKFICCDSVCLDGPTCPFPFFVHLISPLVDAVVGFYKSRDAVGCPETE
eukprot:scaffold3901_cov174-Amphora_coffeaeformis.AAC.8